MPHDIYYIKQNDTTPSFEAICRKGDGSPASLTGATVKFFMRLLPAGAVKISSGTMTTVGVATKGRQNYAWAASDTDTAGTYEAEIQATYTDGKIQTFPPVGYITVEITDDIA